MGFIEAKSGSGYLKHTIEYTFNFWCFLKNFVNRFHSQKYEEASQSVFPLGFSFFQKKTKKTTNSKNPTNTFFLNGF